MIFKQIPKLLLVCISFCLAGFLLQCAPALRPPAISPTETRWQIIPLILQKNFNRLGGLKGSGKLVVESPEMSYSANATIVYKSPDSILIKVEAIFGIDVGTLFADRNAFKVYVPTHNTLYFGASDALENNQFVTFKMNYDRLVKAVTGLNLADEIRTGILKKSDKNFILYGKSNGHYLKYWIDSRLGVVTRCETRNRQNELLQLEEYSRFVKSNGVYVPRTIIIKRPPRKESFTLFYESVTANPEIHTNDFAIKIPRNASKIML